MCSTPPEVIAAVDAAVAVRVEALPVAELQGVIARWSAAAARLTGVVSRALGELETRSGGLVPDAGGADCPTPAWLRSVAHLSGTAAGRQVRTAVALRELPLVAEAIIDGVLTVDHGRVLSRLVGRIEPAALRGSQPDLVEVARRTDPDSLAHYVRHLIATWCEPALAAEDRRFLQLTAEDRRFLQLTAEHNGSWRGRFSLPDAAMETVLTVLEPLARPAETADDRSAGQRRADALVKVFGLALRLAELPDAGGARPRVTVVVPAGRAPDCAPDRAPDCGPGDRRFSVDADRFSVDADRPPGERCPSAPWTGPVSRARVQLICCDAGIERLVVDQAGRIVSLASVGGEISAGQRRAVTARDRCCTAKGCTRPPAFCDVHHLIPRADGGPTETANLALLSPAPRDVAPRTADAERRAGAVETRAARAGTSAGVKAGADQRRGPSRTRRLSGGTGRAALAWVRGRTSRATRG